MANRRHPMATSSRWLDPMPTFALAAVSLLVVAGPAIAHGAGGGPGEVQAQRLPAWVTWAAGAGVVAISFALVGLFLTRETEPDPKRADPIEAGDVTGLPRGLVGTLRLVGLILLAAVVAAGIVPWDPGPGVSRLVWILLWAGLPIAAYTLGNVWAIMSPFRALAGLAERLRGSGPRLTYPAWLGTWPAVGLLAGMIVLEVIAPGPAWLGRLALVYTTFTLVGMATFGSRSWLANAEVFDRAFAWWASAGPGRLTPSGWRWRAPGAELVTRRAAGASDAAFLVGLLYGTTADGFLSTAVGQGLISALGGPGSIPAVVIVVLAGFVAFLAVFGGCVMLIRTAAGTLRSTSELASVFAVTLVPIAIGYHLAHNLAYVVESLPLVVDALADPLNLAAGQASAWTVVSSRPELLVLVQMLLVVLGHIAAVVLAHRRSFTAFASKVQAVKSELPLTGAMLVYTLVSLWIVSSAHAGGIA